jgi:hypothetical protein
MSASNFIIKLVFFQDNNYVDAMEKEEFSDWKNMDADERRKLMLKRKKHKVKLFNQTLCTVQRTKLVW